MLAEQGERGERERENRYDVREEMNKKIKCKVTVIMYIYTITVARTGVGSF